MENKYDYLGITLQSSLSFTNAKETIYKKGLKACFKLNKMTFNTNMKPTIKLKLFNQMIKPICLYGCELWVPSLGKSKAKNNRGQI